MHLIKQFFAKELNSATNSICLVFLNLFNVMSDGLNVFILLGKYWIYLIKSAVHRELCILKAPLIFFWRKFEQYLSLIFPF